MDRFRRALGTLIWVAPFPLIYGALAWLPDYNDPYVIQAMTRVNAIAITLMLTSMAIYEVWVAFKKK